MQESDKALYNQLDHRQKAYHDRMYIYDWIMYVGAVIGGTIMGQSIWVFVFMLPMALLLLIPGVLCRMNVRSNRETFPYLGVCFILSVGILFIGQFAGSIESLFKK